MLLGSIRPTKAPTCGSVLSKGRRDALDLSYWSLRRTLSGAMPTVLGETVRELDAIQDPRLRFGLVCSNTLTRRVSEGSEKLSTLNSRTASLKAVAWHPDLLDRS